MNTIEAICRRRSIRRFKSKKVDKNKIKKIIEIAIRAPSGKNKQPWRYIILGDESKFNVISVMENKLLELQQDGKNTGSLKWTIECMREAPGLILVFNSGMNSYKSNKEFKRHRWMVDIQSIGASIQNFLLAAREMGLGTLWICDIFYADKEICSLLNKDNELVAAISLGYADRTPHQRPRLAVEEVLEWLD